MANKKRTKAQAEAIYPILYNSEDPIRPHIRDLVRISDAIEELTAAIVINTNKIKKVYISDLHARELAHDIAEDILSDTATQETLLKKLNNMLMEE